MLERSNLESWKLASGPVRVRPPKDGPRSVGQQARPLMVGQLALMVRGARLEANNNSATVGETRYDEQHSATRSARAEFRPRHSCAVQADVSIGLPDGWWATGVFFGSMFRLSPSWIDQILNLPLCRCSTDRIIPSQLPAPL